jgi:hypothetical protein
MLIPLGGNVYITLTKVLFSPSKNGIEYPIKSRGGCMDKKWLMDILARIGWSQAELARRIGVSPVTITRWKEVPGPVEAYLILVDRLLGRE